MSPIGTVNVEHDPPKVIIANIGLDQHEVAGMLVSRLLRDAGMEVIYLGRFNTPEAVVGSARSEDADVVGISCHSWEFLEFAEGLVEQLSQIDVPLVLGGSVITSRDAEQLRAQGVKEIFGPQTTSEMIVSSIRQIADDRRARR